MHSRRVGSMVMTNFTYKNVRTHVEENKRRPLCYSEHREPYFKVGIDTLVHTICLRGFNTGLTYGPGFNHWLNLRTNERHTTRDHLPFIQMRRLVCQTQRNIFNALTFGITFVEFLNRNLCNSPICNTCGYRDGSTMIKLWLYGHYLVSEVANLDVYFSLSYLIDN
jgi:hypothetical protein